MMRPAKWLLALALTVALAAYGLDCLGMATPEQSMQCCENMRCHSHHRPSGNTQDCCNATPQMYAALGQPPSAQAISFSPVALGVVQAFDDSEITGFFPCIIAGHSHDPPPDCSTSVIFLRI